MPSDDIFRATRPLIAVAGNEDAPLSRALLRMSVRESVEGLYRAELRFSNWGSGGDGVGFLFFDRRKLEFGKELEVRLGGDVLFAGRISAIEADFGEGRAPQIAVLLEDRFQDLRMTRRTRTFHQQTDAAIIQSIATDHGLTAQVDFPGPTHDVLAQVNQSDLAFVRERARVSDAEVWIDGRTLHGKPRSERTSTPVKLTYGGALRELTATADLAFQRTSLDVTGWDVSGKAAIKETAGDDAIRGELGNDNSGASILRETFGERKESIAHMVPLTSDEASSQAEAWFRVAARRFLVARGLAHPNGKLRAGTWVELDGLGKLFSGKYYLAEVQHLFDGADGFRSEFTAERPGLGAA